MKLRTASNSIDVEAGYGDCYTRVVVYEEQDIGGYGLTITAIPYPTFIVEWTQGGYSYKELLVVPEKHTKAWLDDLVRNKKEDGWELTGIIPLEDVVLPAYVVPEDYREYIDDSGPRPDWYD